MSEHTPLTEAERKSLLVYLDQYDTDEDVNETELFAVVNDIIAARTSTATADKVDTEDDEQFCPDCFAGMTSDQHREACELGFGPWPGKPAPDPEQCRRCEGRNVTWFAPSPLWNFVMRGNDINGDPLWGDLVCMGCFVVLAEEAGIRGRWRLTADPEPDGLVYETPSGRIWDAERWQWIEDER